MHEIHKEKNHSPNTAMPWRYSNLPMLFAIRHEFAIHIATVRNRPEWEIIEITTKVTFPLPTQFLSTARWSHRISVTIRYVLTYSEEARSWRYYWPCAVGAVCVQRRRGKFAVLHKSQTRVCNAIYSEATYQMMLNLNYIYEKSQWRIFAR